MDPEAIRRCMSFGFSDKKSISAIGQCMHVNYHGVLFCVMSCELLTFSILDGNGFKTSSMRLGADVIVFSRCTKNRCGS